MNVRLCPHVEHVVHVVRGWSYVVGVLSGRGLGWGGAELSEAIVRHRGVNGRNQDKIRLPCYHDMILQSQGFGYGGFHPQKQECNGLFRSLCGICGPICWAFIGWSVRGAFLKGERSHCQVFNVPQRYGVAPITRA